MLSAVVTVAVARRRAAGAAGSRRPTRSIRRSCHLMNSLIPPRWIEGGDPVPARHRQPGPRPAFPPFSTACGFRSSSACSASPSPATLGITLGLIAGYVGGAVDACIMRVADVQLTFPAILIALLVDGVVHARVRQRSAREHGLRRAGARRSACRFWVQYARTVRGSTHGREEQGLRAGRPTDRPARRR